MLSEKAKDFYYNDAEQFWPKHIELNDKPTIQCYPSRSLEYFFSHIQEVDPEAIFVNPYSQKTDLEKYWNQKRRQKAETTLMPKSLQGTIQSSGILYTKIPENILTKILEQVTQNDYAENFFFNVMCELRDEYEEMYGLDTEE